MTTVRASLALSLLAVLALPHPAAGATREEFLFGEARDLFDAQKYTEAIERLEELLDRDPANWAANRMAAMCYLAIYHPGSSAPKDVEYARRGIAAFERTLELSAPSLEDQEKIEKYYLSFLEAAGEGDKAIAYLERQLAARPSDLALMSQIAAVYERKGEFSSALEYYERLAATDADTKERWYTLGVSCWGRSYHAGAELSQDERETIVAKGIAAMDKALAIDPDYFDALAYINLLYREKAKVLTANGRFSEAEVAFATADDYQKRAIEIRNHRTLRPDGE